MTPLPMCWFFEETDAEFYVSVWLSRSRDFVIIGSFQTESTEIRTIPADVPTSEAQVFLPRTVDHEYSIDHHDGRFFVRSNFEAPNHRIAVTEQRTIQSMSETVDVVAPSDDVFVEDFGLFNDALVVEERATPFRECGSCRGRRRQLPIGSSSTKRSTPPGSGHSAILRATLCASATPRSRPRCGSTTFRLPIARSGFARSNRCSVDLIAMPTSPGACS